MAVLIVVALMACAEGAHAQGAALTEPRAALDRALECHGALGGDGPPPVILVHGTGSTPEESFGFGYLSALPRRGFAVCTVRLPGLGLVDQQRSIQYVVHAVREVARLSGRKVSLVGYSQGATLATYATYLWPDLPAKLDDVIGLAGPYQGTTTANDRCADGRCPVFAWQFRSASKLNAAFHAARRPAGPSCTAIATAFDDVVAPAPGAARLDGAANVVLQDVCALRPIDHYLLIGDAVTFALVLDALTHAGPVDPSRVDPATCLQTLVPGADLVQTVTAPVAIANTIARVAAAPDVDREPALRCPLDPADCPAPQVRLTRRCAAGGRLRVALAGDVDAVRSADFKLAKRLVRRVAVGPFTATLPARTLTRAGRARLRAVAALASPPGGRVVLERTLPGCAA
jgi:triacylglycerol lipase